MLAVPLTFTLCLITAISRILLKKGLVQSNALTGMVVSLVVGWVALAITSAILLPANTQFDLRSILFFAGIGLVAPPVVRYLTYIGVDRLGASRSDPVRSLTPFFAILFAILFLREEATIYVFLGAGLIFAGVLLLSRGGGGAGEPRSWKTTDLLYPLGAAILAGAVANLRKYGSGMMDSPVLAAFVAATSAIFAFGIFLFASGKWRKVTLDRGSAKYFILSGICTSATDVLDILVLKLGKITVVSPLLATSPLFIILLSHLFLRGVEKVTWSLVLGAIVIFCGVEVILLYVH